jgi:hypothetical protein
MNTMPETKPVPRRRHDPEMANYVYKGEDRAPSDRSGPPANRARGAEHKAEDKPGK